MGAPYERRLACEMVASEVYAGILNGDFEINRPLPSERVLARRLGVDRGTLREGLARLAARGLLEARQGVGTWVTDPDSLMGGEQLVDWFELSDHLVNCEVAALSLLEIRTTFLARAAGRLAARGIEAADLEMLEHYVRVMEYHLGRGSLRMTILEAELGFQQHLVAAAGLAFSMGFGPYAKLMRRYLFCFGLPETCPSIPVGAYRALLEAIQRRDRAGAMATVDGAFEAYDREVIGVLLEESKLRIAYRRGPGPRTTDWELEVDQREQSRQHALVGPSNQCPPPWQTPRRNAAHGDSPDVRPGPMAPHGPLHYRSPERQREEEELFQEYALPEEEVAPGDPEDERPEPEAPAPARPPGEEKPASEDPPPATTSTAEREPDG